MRALLLRLLASASLVNVLLLLSFGCGAASTCRPDAVILLHLVSFAQLETVKAKRYKRSATTLLLLLACICTRKDVHCSRLKIFDQRSFKHANSPLSVQSAENGLIVGQGSKSCWSPCDRLTSSRSHLPVYDSLALVHVIEVRHQQSLRTPNQRKRNS